jgi:hypothetical protein
MNADQVAEAIKASGCAVTAVNDNGLVRLHSASQGIGFQVMWGNALREGEYVDLTLSCPLRVQGGTLPEGLLGEWHRSKRFVRLPSMATLWCWRWMSWPQAASPHSIWP